MNAYDVQAELERIAALPAPERAAAAEDLESQLRAELDEIAPDQRPA